MDAAERADGDLPADIAARRGEPPHYPFQPVRTRALEAFDDPAAAGVKLVAVVAPVGYGKTIFLSAIHNRLAQQGRRCFWIALDERDTRVEDLLQRMEILATRNSRRLHPTQVLFRGDETTESRIESMVKTIAGYPYPFNAFIDNLNYCTDPRVGDLLDRLIFQTPEHAHFVFSSTASLAINMARAKLERRVRQVGHADLSLDATGAAQLLGPEIVGRLGAEHIDTVLQQTEGWPAAVRMMQIAMADIPQPLALLQQFSGSDEDIVALLNRQVLQGLPDELRHFLLAIAPLHTFDASLCAAVTGSANAQTFIADLVRRNVFIIPLDRIRKRYRLHGLFRQCLLAEVRHCTDEASRQEALARAARWCEQAGNPRDAVDYALAANDTEVAIRVLERSAPFFVRDRGDTPQYIAWARSLIDQGCTLGWEAEYWYVWALVLNQRYDEGRHQLERLSRRLRRIRVDTRDEVHLHDLERRLDIIRISVDVFTDALWDADQKVSRWLDSSSGDDPFNITVVRCTRSIICSGEYRFWDAREAVQAARAPALQSGSHYALGWVVALDALPSVLEGHYPRVYPALLSALDELPEHLGENAGICGTIALLAAGCAVEMGLDEDVAHHLEQGLRTAHSHGFIDAVASGLDAALKMWPGDPMDTELPERLQQIASAYPPRLAFILGCYRIRRMLRLGRLDDAQAEAARIGIGGAPPAVLPEWAHGSRGRDVLYSTVIDLQIAAGRGRAVSDLLEEQLRLARSENRLAREVDLLLLATLVEVGDPINGLAMRHLVRAVRLATPLRLVRPFRDLAPTLAGLIEDTKPSAWGFALVEERRFFADLCCRLPIRDPGLQDRLMSLNSEVQLLDPLTPRQMELLMLIESGLTNRQIADRIDRTESTVKGHLQALYEKLGVCNRAAALARARLFKLL